MLVGYKYGAIDIGSYQYDECLKIKDTPEKCSWRTMGTIDDIYALQYSSNVYQYKIAIKVGGGTYRYNEGLSIDASAFDKYREMYASFGLGVKTGIDLPVESLGYMGESKLPGHLLDFSIGQYDTYTPIQLSQYINTLANGDTRLKVLFSDYGRKFSELDEDTKKFIISINYDDIAKIMPEIKKLGVTNIADYAYLIVNSSADIVNRFNTDI